MKKLAPVVLFTYNRLRHLRITINALKENDMAGESILFIFSDGPRDDEDESRVNAVRDFLSRINGFKDVIVVNRDRNWGLADNIVDGVTRVINEYGRAIVLEDDIVTSPYFLRFMNEALRIYEGEDRVMHISGYMFPIKKEGLPGAFFIKPTTCWGWATWKEAWKAFNREAKKWIGYFNEEEIRDFNLNHAYDYWEQLRLNYEGKIKTWAIFWYLSVYAVGGLSLHPRDSLTRNIGFDKRGTHCRELPFHRDELSYNSEWDFPREIKESSLARNRLEEYFNKIKGLSQKSAEIPNFYANLRDLIKRMIYHEGL